MWPNLRFPEDLVTATEEMLIKNFIFDTISNDLSSVLVMFLERLFWL